MRSNPFGRKRYKSHSKRQRKSPGQLNKTEQAYSRVLEAMKSKGDYESERLRLADNTYYVPDFRVLMADGTIEFHEVKACKASSAFLCEDDARVKFKVAAEQHWMYGWRMVGLRGGVVVKQEVLNCEVQS
jgi:hypothetical protein